mgnify:CR=1 FL=1
MVRETRASCLGKGTALYRCRETREEKEIVTAPFGHCDSDQDSLCDRCRRRAFGQEEGSKIHAVLGGRNMTFTCIDADYQSSSLPEGGMLYLADQKVETGFFWEDMAPACMKTARSGDISAMAFRMDVPWEKPWKEFRFLDAAGPITP